MTDDSKKSTKQGQSLSDARHNFFSCHSHNQSSNLRGHRSTTFKAGCWKPPCGLLPWIAMLVLVARVHRGWPQHPAFALDVLIQCGAGSLMTMSVSGVVVPSFLQDPRMMAMQGAMGGLPMMQGAGAGGLYPSVSHLSFFISSHFSFLLALVCFHVVAMSSVWVVVESLNRIISKLYWTKPLSVSD